MPVLSDLTFWCMLYFPTKTKRAPFYWYILIWTKYSSYKSHPIDAKNYYVLYVSKPNPLPLFITFVYENYAGWYNHPVPCGLV
jgi:hypothetical protein